SCLRQDTRGAQPQRREAARRAARGLAAGRDSRSLLGAGLSQRYKAHMTIASMTGFARVEGHDGALSWVWEVKSVNAKSLDLRFRLPGGFEALELPLRASVNQKFRRGAVTAGLSVTKATGAAG